MSTYILVALAAVVVVAILQRWQSSDLSSMGVPSDVPRDAEGVKLLLARGHPLQAMRLAREISAGDPARARALLEELQIHIKVSGTGDAASTLAGILEPARDRELQAHLLSGNKIEAITRWRALTGEGLKESKDAIDRLSTLPPSGSDHP